ncbi:MAG: aromatic ring-hydroxylating oxygenase subunit alpha [Actinomycetota bacterium]
MSTPAPLHPDSLRLCLDRFPEAARTLPAEAFASDEVFAWEMENFFTAAWVCVGRTDSVAGPGDQVAVRVGTEGVLVIRGEDATLRGFFNVCRHRGHELMECGTNAINRAVVRCPYHRWTYALDGTFKGGPGLASVAGFDRKDPSNNLVPAPVREWRGWIFANVSGAPDFSVHIGELDALIADYESERLLIGASHSYDIAANWKVIAENFHECYHCSEIHPELCRVSSPSSGQDYEPSGLVIGGSMTLNEGVETMSLDGTSKGVPFRRLSGQRLREVYYLQVWPNLLLSMHPDYVMTHILQPTAPDRTRVECSWLFPPETMSAPDFDASYAADFWDVTNRQDWRACEAVQRGVHSRAYRQGPLSDQERVVHQAITLVARGYLEGGPPQPVVTRGRVAAS